MRPRACKKLDFGSNFAYSQRMVLHLCNAVADTDFTDRYTYFIFKASVVLA
jgi:hypothetical protein